MDEIDRLSQELDAAQAEYKAAHDITDQIDDHSLTNPEYVTAERRVLAADARCRSAALALSALLEVRRASTPVKGEDNDDRAQAAPGAAGERRDT